MAERMTRLTRSIPRSTSPGRDFGSRGKSAWSLEGDGNRRRNVAKRRRQAVGRGDALVVVSAMGREGQPYATAELVKIVKSIDPKIEPRELDLLMSCGEIISTVVLAHLLRTKGYGQGTLAFRLLRLADLQRVDMGIAMCHFALACREYGLAGTWAPALPGRRPVRGLELIATFRVR